MRFHRTLANLCKRLRYLLGGDRPSQTTHQTLSPDRFHGTRLELKTNRGGISLATHSDLVARSQSLPPILNRSNLNSMPSCSKASRGLFVLLWVTGIFTGPVISPSPSLRQSSDRCAIRAGRNLPDKEFRYLRTIIVIAGVHPGFGSRLAPITLTFGHWPGISPYTSPYGLAGTCVFDKQSPEVFCCSPPNGGQALSRSYGRCFAEFLNEGSLVHLRLLASPTCVGLRYGLYIPNV